MRQTFKFPAPLYSGVIAKVGFELSHQARTGIYAGQRTGSFRVLSADVVFM